MTVSVRLPVRLMELTRIVDKRQYKSGTAADILTQVQAQYPQLAMHLYDENGALRQRLLCRFNGEISHDFSQSFLSSGDELVLVYAVTAG